MNALNYLNEVINNHYAFVPESIAVQIVEAARTLGIAICGGLYDSETQQRVLYLA